MTLNPFAEPKGRSNSYLFKWPELYPSAVVVNDAPFDPLAFLIYSQGFEALSESSSITAEKEFIALLVDGEAQKLISVCDQDRDGFVSKIEFPMATTISMLQMTVMEIFRQMKSGNF